ncbi:MAG TPA: DNRLRE domain-containing protein [Bacteroidia bacterium]|nr:DNRLRE domain-containing protein [Bacteroidia bacterium]
MRAIQLTAILAAMPLYGMAQTTLTLQPNGASGIDAEIFSCVVCGYDNTNFGNKKDFNAITWTNSGSVSKVRSLIKFDLSAVPANAFITSAYLSLYFNPTSIEGNHSGSNAAYLQRITSSWDESTVTWNNQPSTTTANRITLPTASNNTQNYLNIDITYHIQDMAANPGSNFGFMLLLQNESVYRKMVLASSDNPDATLRPKLVITYTTPLPITLTSFDATCSASAIDLNWTTATESDFEGFLVERSQNPVLGFEPVAWVKGKGNSSATQHYNFADENVVSGTKYYYRLKQTDFSGQFEYSKIIAAGCSAAAAAPIRCGPNPFTSTTTVTFNLTESSQLMYSIYTATGKLVYQSGRARFEAGQHVIGLDETQLGNSYGVFLFLLEGPDKHESCRISRIP